MSPSSGSETLHVSGTADDLDARQGIQRQDLLTEVWVISGSSG